MYSDHSRGHRLRRPGDRRLPGGFRQPRALRGHRRAEDRAPLDGRDAVLRARPRRAGRAQRAGGPAHVRQRPRRGAQGRAGRLHHRRHAAARRTAAPTPAPIYAVAKIIAQNLDGYKLVVQKSTAPVGTARDAAGLHREAGREARRRVRRRLEPRVPARGLGDRDLHAPRPRRDRRRDASARPTILQEDPRPAVPDRDADGGHRRSRPPS